MAILVVIVRVAIRIVNPANEGISNRISNAKLEGTSRCILLIYDLSLSLPPLQLPDSLPFVFETRV